MQDTGSNVAGVSQSGRMIRLLNEVLFSLNLVVAAGLGLLLYITRNLMNLGPENAPTYYYLRAAVRLNLLVHRYRPDSHVSGMSRYFRPQWDQAGHQLAIVFSIACATTILFFLLRLFLRPQVRYRMLDRVSLWAAMIAMPISYLCVEWATWSLPREFGPRPSGPFWQSTLLSIFLVELVFILTIILASRRWAVSTWVILLFLSIHFVIWLPLFWVEVVGRNWVEAVLFSFTPWLLLVLPLAAILSVLSVRIFGANLQTEKERRGIGKFGVIAAALSFVILFGIWRPNWSYRIARPKDMNSVILGIYRGGCFGSCPIYEITIHGNGVAEYAGHQFVRVRDQQTTIISAEQLNRLLRELEELDFMAIEDRAFPTCADAPTVEVFLSFDGHKKTVLISPYCTPGSSGKQFRLAQFANEIDALVGSERWVKCEVRCSPK